MVAASMVLKICLLGVAPIAWCSRALDTTKVCLQMRGGIMICLRQPGQMVKENNPPCISGEQEDFRLLCAAFVAVFYCRHLQRLL